MDLTPFIRELILINESVILRGFGGFDTSYKDASFNERKNKFTPPTKKITFRPEWIVDNGVLAKHISETTSITIEKASEVIDQFVNELFTKLNVTGIIELEGIGRFTGSEGKITSFTPFENENYLADSFGLDILEIEGVQKIIPQPVVEKTTPVIPRRSNKVKWFVAVGLLLILAVITSTQFFPGVAGLKITDLLKSSEQSADTTEIIVFGTHNDVLQDSVSKSISNKLDQSTNAKNALQPTVSKTNMPATTQTVETAGTKKMVGQVEVVKLSYFYVVAGSFKNRRNAEVLKEQLEEKGYFPEIVSTTNNFFHVTVAKFDNMSSATDEKVRLRSQFDQTLWVLEK